MCDHNLHKQPPGEEILAAVAESKVLKPRNEEETGKGADSNEVAKMVVRTVQTEGNVANRKKSIEQIKQKTNHCL